MNSILKNAQTVGGFAARTSAQVARRLPGAAATAGQLVASLLERRGAGSGPAPAPGPAPSPAPEQSTPTAPAPAPASAPAPPDLPGASVTPSFQPGSEVERAEQIDAVLGLDGSDGPLTGDALVAREEAAAAAEAAGIGGYVSSEIDDPALNPVYEAGGGEAEGFEAAERALIENATHGDGHGDPLRDAIATEAEADHSTAVYAEADHIESSEVSESSEAEPGDPPRRAQRS